MFDEDKLHKTFVEVLNWSASQGAGFFQSDTVLDEVGSRLHPKDVAEEQQILRRFRQFFSDGLLCEGLDLDNPKLPFMHVTPKGVEHGLRNVV